MTAVLWILAAVLMILWLGGISFSISAGYTHLPLPVAAIVVVINLVIGGKPA